jgi:hypothetical protein
MGIPAGLSGISGATGGGVTGGGITGAPGGVTGGVTGGAGSTAGTHPAKTILTTITAVNKGTINFFMFTP